MRIGGKGPLTRPSADLSPKGEVKSLPTGHFCIHGVIPAQAGIHLEMD